MTRCSGGGTTLVRREKNSVRDSVRSLAQTLGFGAAGLFAVLSLLSCSASPAVHVAKTETALPADIKGTPQRVRLIAQQQYLNTLAYVFGPDLRIDARFPPPVRVDGLLASDAASAGVTGAQLEQFQRAASQVAGIVVNAAHREY